MLIDMLLVFIVISVILFILTLFIMEDNPMLAIPLIMVNMIFIVIITYGLWNVEYSYVGTNATTGLMEYMTYSTTSYGDPYSYIFVLFFFIHVMLFFKTGFDMWKDALKTKGEMNYYRRR